MADGVTVLGNYESTNWTRCAANTTTVIQPQTPEGVTFPAAVGTVAATTVLDGFRVDRFNAATTAGITVDRRQGRGDLQHRHHQHAGRHQLVRRQHHQRRERADHTQCHIDAGTGTVESIGVRAVGAKVDHPEQLRHASTPPAAATPAAGTTPRSAAGSAPGTGDTYGRPAQQRARLDRPDHRDLLRTQADHGAGIRISGDATGMLVRGNNINAFGGVQDSHGIWMEDCNDAAPWIVDNFNIAADGRERADARPTACAPSAPATRSSTPTCRSPAAARATPRARTASTALANAAMVREPVRGAGQPAHPGLGVRLPAGRHGRALRRRRAASASPTTPSPGAAA